MSTIDDRFMELVNAVSDEEPDYSNVQTRTVACEDIVVGDRFMDDGKMYVVDNIITANGDLNIISHLVSGSYDIWFSCTDYAVVVE